MGGQDYETVKNPYCELNNGRKIPQIGLGTWKGEKGQVGQAVQTALRLGYRHIDCAKAYKNQEEVGAALQAVFKEGKVKREDVWVTSKLWNDEHGRVEEACRATLAELQLDYLDEYLVHWPVTGNAGPEVDPPIKDTWQQMEALVDKGLVKSIGVSNFSVKKMEDLLSYARITPAVEQVELHPYFRNDKLHSFLNSKGIHLTAYSPLGSPDSAAIEKRGEDTPKLMQDQVVKQVADKLGKSPAQILIRWALQNGTSVIPKATSEAHLRSNLDVLNWEIPKEDFERLNNIRFQMRMVDGTMFLKEEGPYKTVHELWDGEVPSSNPEVDRPTVGGKGQPAGPAAQGDPISAEQ